MSESQVNQSYYIHSVTPDTSATDAANVIRDFSNCEITITVSLDGRYVVVATPEDKVSCVKEMLEDLKNADVPLTKAPSRKVAPGLTMNDVEAELTKANQANLIPLLLGVNSNGTLWAITPEALDAIAAVVQNREVMVDVEPQAVEHLVRIESGIIAQVADSSSVPDDWISKLTEQLIAAKNVASFDFNGRVMAALHAGVLDVTIHFKTSDGAQRFAQELRAGANSWTLKFPNGGPVAKFVWSIVSPAVEERRVVTLEDLAKSVASGLAVPVDPRIAGRRVVLLCGTTQAGKTTTVSSVTGRVMVITKEPGAPNVVEGKNPLQQNEAVLQNRYAIVKPTQEHADAIADITQLIVDPATDSLLNGVALPPQHHFVRLSHLGPVLNTGAYVLVPDEEWRNLPDLLAVAKEHLGSSTTTGVHYHAVLHADFDGVVDTPGTNDTAGVFADVHNAVMRHTAAQQSANLRYVVCVDMALVTTAAGQQLDDYLSPIIGSLADAQASLAHIGILFTRFVPPVSLVETTTEDQRMAELHQWVSTMRGHIEGLRGGPVMSTVYAGPFLQHALRELIVTEQRLATRSGPWGKATAVHPLLPPNRYLTDVLNAVVPLAPSDLRPCLGAKGNAMLGDSLKFQLEQFKYAMRHDRVSSALQFAVKMLDGLNQLDAAGVHVRRDLVPLTHVVDEMKTLLRERRTQRISALRDAVKSADVSAVGISLQQLRVHDKAIRDVVDSVPNEALKEAVKQQFGLRDRPDASSCAVAAADELLQHSPPYTEITALVESRQLTRDVTMRVAALTSVSRECQGGGRLAINQLIKHIKTVFVNVLLDIQTSSQQLRFSTVGVELVRGWVLHVEAASSAVANVVDASETNSSEDLLTHSWVREQRHASLMNLLDSLTCLQRAVVDSARSIASQKEALASDLNVADTRHGFEELTKIYGDADIVQAFTGVVLSSSAFRDAVIGSFPVAYAELQRTMATVFDGTVASSSSIGLDRLKEAFIEVHNHLLAAQILAPADDNGDHLMTLGVKAAEMRQHFFTAIAADVARADAPLSIPLHRFIASTAFGVLLCRRGHPSHLEAEGLDDVRRAFALLTSTLESTIRFAESCDAAKKISAGYVACLACHERMRRCDFVSAVYAMYPAGLQTIRNQHGQWSQAVIDSEVKVKSAVVAIIDAMTLPTDATTTPPCYQVMGQWLKQLNDLAPFSAVAVEALAKRRQLVEFAKERSATLHNQVQAAVGRSDYATIFSVILGEGFALETSDVMKELEADSFQSFIDLLHQFVKAFAARAKTSITHGTRTLAQSAASDIRKALSTATSPHRDKLTLRENEIREVTNSITKRLHQEKETWINNLSQNFKTPRLESLVSIFDPDDAREILETLTDVYSTRVQALRDAVKVSLKPGQQSDHALILSAYRNAEYCATHLDKFMPSDPSRIDEITSLLQTALTKHANEVRDAISHEDWNRAITMLEKLSDVDDALRGVKKVNMETSVTDLEKELEDAVKLQAQQHRLALQNAESCMRQYAEDECQRFIDTLDLTHFPPSLPSTLLRSIRREVDALKSFLANKKHEWVVAQQQDQQAGGFTAQLQRALASPDKFTQFLSQHHVTDWPRQAETVLLQWAEYQKNSVSRNVLSAAAPLKNLQDVHEAFENMACTTLPAAIKYQQIFDRCLEDVQQVVRAIPLIDVAKAQEFELAVLPSLAKLLKLASIVPLFQDTLKSHQTAFARVRASAFMTLQSNLFTAPPCAVSDAALWLSVVQRNEDTVVEVFRCRDVQEAINRCFADVLQSLKAVSEEAPSDDEELAQCDRILSEIEGKIQVPHAVRKAIKSRFPARVQALRPPAPAAPTSSATKAPPVAPQALAPQPAEPAPRVPSASNPPVSAPPAYHIDAVHQRVIGMDEALHFVTPVPDETSYTFAADFINAIFPDVFASIELSLDGHWLIASARPNDEAKALSAIDDMKSYEGSTTVELLPAAVSRLPAGTTWSNVIDALTVSHRFDLIPHIIAVNAGGTLSAVTQEAASFAARVVVPQRQSPRPQQHQEPRPAIRQAPRHVDPVVNEDDLVFYVGNMNNNSFADVYSYFVSNDWDHVFCKMEATTDGAHFVAATVHPELADQIVDEMKNQMGSLVPHLRRAVTRKLDVPATPSEVVDALARAGHFHLVPKVLHTTRGGLLSTVDETVSDAVAALLHPDPAPRAAEAVEVVDDPLEVYLIPIGTNFGPAVVASVLGLTNGFFRDVRELTHHPYIVATVTAAQSDRVPSIQLELSQCGIDLLEAPAIKLSVPMTYDSVVAKLRVLGKSNLVPAVLRVDRNGVLSTVSNEIASQIKALMQQPVAPAKEL